MTDNNFVTTKQFDKFIAEETRHHELTEEAAAKRGEQLTAALNQLESIAKWRGRVDSALEKHDHILFGNGEPGMDEAIRNINEWIKKQEHAWSDTKKFAVGTIAFVVNTLLAILISRLVG